MTSKIHREWDAYFIRDVLKYPLQRDKCHLTDYVGGPVWDWMLWPPEL